MKKKEQKANEKTVNICLKCGRPIPKNEKFCFDCGLSINVRSSYPHNLL